MNQFKLNIYRYENQRAGRNVEVMFSVNGSEIAASAFLDMDIFFKTLNHAGTFEYFTCTCGVFGCGGYYATVKHTKKYYILKDIHYNRHPKPTAFIAEYKFSWEKIISIAHQILNVLRDFYAADDNYELNSFDEFHKEIVKAMGLRLRVPATEKSEKKGETGIMKITVMSDFGDAIFWDDEGTCIGGSSGISDESDNDLPISESLLKKFSEWHSVFEKAAIEFIDAYEKKREQNFDWKSYHKIGRQLTAELQKELGEKFEIVYDKPFEDPHPYADT